MRTSFAALAAMMIVLAGCASLGPQETRRHYVLEAGAGAAARTAAAARAATLLVTPATVSGFYESPDIVYSRVPGQRAYYQFHAWTERPGRRFTELLVARMEGTGSFRAVATAVSGVRGDVILGTHLAEFYHDASTAPGSVRVVVTAELTDPLRRALLARRSFERTVPAPTHDAPGAVQAFGVAVTGILDDLATWVDESAPR
ncbi:MAG: membrane integrity-associated transporter subunit PqiC [Burkholderiales bacterium]|nr:membrane integrity-associated transporter subunit PqiC [Burkholderiales bacterium]